MIERIIRFPLQNRIRLRTALRRLWPGNDADVGYAEKQSALDDARNELQSVVQCFGIVNRAERAIENMVAVVRHVGSAVGRHAV